MAEKSDDRTQADKFKALAPKLECDEDEKAFEEKVKRIATAKEKPQEDGNGEG